MKHITTAFGLLAFICSSRKYNQTRAYQHATNYVTNQVLKARVSETVPATRENPFKTWSKRLGLGIIAAKISLYDQPKIKTQLYN